MRSAAGLLLHAQTLVSEDIQCVGVQAAGACTVNLELCATGAMPLQRTNQATEVQDQPC
jgi:hypothetical protein